MKYRFLLIFISTIFPFFGQAEMDKKVLPCPTESVFFNIEKSVVAFNCGGKVGLKDLKKNSLFLLFPDRKEISTEEFLRLPADDAPDLIGWFGKTLFFGDCTTGGWDQLCQYIWPKAKAICGNVPFTGFNSIYAIDSSGQHSVFSKLSDSENKTIEVKIYEFKTKKMASLSQFKPKSTKAMWKLDWSSDRVVLTGENPQSSAPKEQIQWSSTEALSKLKKSSSVWTQ